MKTLPLALLALVLVSPAGQAVAQVTCSDGRTPAQQCEAMHVVEMNQAQAALTSCFDTSTTDEDVAECDDLFDAIRTNLRNGYSDCVAANECNP